jgi:hypothetical protein
LFPALAGAPDVRSGAEVDVGVGERGELGDRQPGLDGECGQGVVAASGPAGPVRRGEQCLSLAGRQVGHRGLAEAGGRDGQDLLDQVRVLGVAQRGVAEQRMDRGQPRVAGPRAVTAVTTQVFQEGPDEGGVEVVQAQVARLGAGALLGEAQQQSEGIPVGGDGVAADLPLGDQPFGEERLQDRGERGHRALPGPVSSRPAARAGNSGVAVRYQ